LISHGTFGSWAEQGVRTRNELVAIHEIPASVFGLFVVGLFECGSDPCRSSCRLGLPNHHQRRNSVGRIDEHTQADHGQLWRREPILNGQNGSSDWFVPATGSTNTELNAFSGTGLNAGTGFSTTTTGAAALALLNTTANGKAAVFRFSMAGFQDLAVSYVTQRTTTGFTTQTWAFSTDGTNWTDHQTLSTLPTTFATQTLTTITGLNGAADAYLRLTVTGATGASGNNRLDNIQFNAAAVPEPTSLLLVGSVSIGAFVYRRRRNRS
jgi:hypothetical protein